MGGGNIEFHKNPRLEPKHDEIISVEPLFNRAVIFETNNISWHGFPRINIPADKGSLSRKSFALYYYTDQRDQQIKPHSTIYVERHLTKKYHAGMTIDNDQLAEIKTLLARRDQHLERLYNNITHLMTEVRDLKWSLGQANHKIKSAESKPVEVSGQLASTNQANDTDESWEKAELLSRIKELENSTSWRITAPLRKLKKWFSREQ